MVGYFFGGILILAGYFFRRDNFWRDIYFAGCYFLRDICWGRIFFGMGYFLDGIFLGGIFFGRDFVGLMNLFARLGSEIVVHPLV